MPEFRKSCKVQLALGAQTYRAEFHGDDMFGKAISMVKEKVIAYYVRGTIENIEKALGVFMMILGDYAVELLRSQMAPYGTPSGSVHVVTGSFLTAIENQSSGNLYRGPMSEKGHAGSVRSTLQIGINPDESRFERSALLANAILAGSLKGVRLHNTGENVAGYGQRYFDSLQEGSEMISTVREALIEIVSGRTAWEWLRMTGRISQLRAHTEQLRAQNMKMIEEAAQARLAEKMR